MDIQCNRLARAVEDLRKLLSPGHRRAGLAGARSSAVSTTARPFSVELTSLQTLRIAPDGPLHRLPFAALWNADQQRYLLATHQLIMADGIGTARASDLAQTMNAACWLWASVCRQTAAPALQTSPACARVCRHCPRSAPRSTRWLPAPAP